MLFAWFPFINVLFHPNFLPGLELSVIAGEVGVLATQRLNNNDGFAFGRVKELFRLYAVESKSARVIFWFAIFSGIEVC